MTYTPFISVLSIFQFTLAVSVVSQEADVPIARVLEQGANHRVWSRVSEHATFDGRISYRTNSYVELATGMSYRKDGQWTDTREEIELFLDGAVARQGPHTVIFSPNIRTAGAIDLLAADGQRFRSHPLLIAYTDAASGNAVMIGEIKDSIGEIIAHNSVLYRDAFTDIRVDVHYVYTRAD
jgi:hypothetical protein